MTKSLTIEYKLDNQENSVNIPVTYDTVEDGNLKTITCTVDDKTDKVIPIWLRPFKFEIKCAMINGDYEMLFSDYSNVRNLEASLFIDKASADILQHEKDTYVAPAAPKKVKRLVKMQA